MTENKIKFSIILPTYNRGYRLSQCIESVIFQKFSNWELIIINDGSKDNTDDVVAKYEDNRIIYFKLKDNEGVNCARNKAINLARGDYAILLDSDNLLTNNILNKYENLILNSKYNYFKFPCKDQNGKYTVADPKFEGTLDYKSFLKEEKRGEYSTLVKLDLLKNNMFFEDIIGGEGITWKLIAKQKQEVRYENFVGLIYDNSGEDRLSLKNKNYARLANVFLKDIKILGVEYLKYDLIFLIKNITKFLLYKFFSFKIL